MSASAHAVLPYVTACQEDFVGDPATISIPVLVIHGDQDRVLPYEASGSRLPALLRDDQPPRARAPITIDLDTTDVEVYDRKKHGGTGSVHSTRAPLTLTTPANTMRDWIATGRAFMRARLAAAQLGLRFHPVSQVVQGYRQMDQLPTEMNTLTGMAEPAKLQMLVRVGRTSQPGLSPRRDLSAIAQPR
jgi:hypothetical protein